MHVAETSMPKSDLSPGTHWLGGTTEERCRIPMCVNKCAPHTGLNLHMQEEQQHGSTEVDRALANSVNLMPEAGMNYVAGCDRHGLLQSPSHRAPCLRTL